MLEKLVRKRKLIASIFAVVLLLCWTLYLIFGMAENKISILVLTIVLPVVIYGFIRLAFKIVSKKASANILGIFSWFFLLGGALGVIMMTMEFISGFPNGLSPSLGACMGMIVAVLETAKRSSS